MTTVTLYFRTSKDVTLLDDFATHRPEWYDETRELWDDGVRYLLPAGYSVARNTINEIGIFDPRNRMCEIAVHSSGRPQLVSAMPNMPVLRRVDEDAAQS